MFVPFLEHSSVPSMKSTCARPHMSWFQALLILMTNVIREGSGVHVHLRNLVRVSLLTNIKFEVDEDSGQIKF